MDVKQGCLYLADRAFRVTDYKDFTETKAGDPLFFLQSPLSARDKKLKPRGIYWPPAQGVGRNEKKK